jgi:RNA polymerase sigma-70 factor, ECF subfamily
MGSPARSPDEFIDLVREHQARLRASIRALGVRAEAVDDVAQEVFLLAWQKMADFSTGDFGAWLMQMARRLVANERRKESRRRRILAGEVTDLLLQSLPQADPSLDYLIRAEEVRALKNCLDELPSKGRRMIQWRYFDQLAPATIADRLGRPSNYVRQALLRLRRLLLECVQARLAHRQR